MYTTLRKLSNLFFVIGAILTVLALVVVFNLLTMGHVHIEYSTFTAFCLVCCVLAVPGLFLSLGFALRAVNKAMFEDKMTLFSMNSSQKE